MRFNMKDHTKQIKWNYGFRELTKRGKHNNFPLPNTVVSINQQLLDQLLNDFVNILKMELSPRYQAICIFFDNLSQNRDLLIEFIKYHQYKAFRYAAENDCDNICRMLIKFDVDVEEMIKAKSYYAFRHAAENGHNHTCSLFLNFNDFGKYIDITEMIKAEDYYAFRYAAKNKHYDLLYQLMDCISEPNYFALLYENCNIILRDLENYGVEYKKIREICYDKLDFVQRSKIRSAIIRNKVDEIKFIPKEEIFRHLSKFNFLSFIDAVKAGHIKVVSFLLEIFKDKGMISAIPIVKMAITALANEKLYIAKMLLATTTVEDWCFATNGIPNLTPENHSSAAILEFITSRYTWQNLNNPTSIPEYYGYFQGKFPSPFLYPPQLLKYETAYAIILPIFLVNKSPIKNWGTSPSLSDNAISSILWFSCFEHTNISRKVVSVTYTAMKDIYYSLEGGELNINLKNPLIALYKWLEQYCESKKSQKCLSLN